MRYIRDLDRRSFAFVAIVYLFAAIWPVSRSARGAGTVPELTAQWWQWALGIPISQSPLFDETGGNAGVDQPFKGNKLFFLAGTFNGSGSATRSITVPAGTSLFFPIVNFVDTDNSGSGHSDKTTNVSLKQLYSVITEAGDSIILESLFVSVDDVDVTALAERVQSPAFAAKLPNNNVFGAKAGTYTPAVSDGYWILLPPLDPGLHMLHFGGAAFDPNLGIDFSLDITYLITVN